MKVRVAKRFERIPNPGLVREVAAAMASANKPRRANRWDESAEGVGPKRGQTWELSWKNVTTGRKVRRLWFLQRVVRWGKGRRVTLRLAGGTRRQVHMPSVLREQYDRWAQTMTVGATELRPRTGLLGRTHRWRLVANPVTHQPER